MTSPQQRIQVYLEKHKIGAIFEGLMLRLARDTPDDPLSYIIESLTRKLSRSRAAGSIPEPKVSGQTSPDAVSIQRKTIDSLRKTVADLRSVAAAETSAGNAEDHGNAKRDYPKPWKVATKQLAREHVDAAMAGKMLRTWSGEKPSWDATVKMTAKDFDELAVQVVPKSVVPPTHAGPKNIALAVTMHKDWHNESPKKSHNSSVADGAESDDPLADELSLGFVKRHMPDVVPNREESAPSSPPRILSRKDAVARRKEELRQIVEQELVVKDVKNMTPHVTSVACGGVVPVELAEDANDLANEGALLPSSLDMKREPVTRPSKRQDGGGVKVSMCAVCARIISTGDISGKSIASSVAEQSKSSNVTLRTHSATGTASPVLLSHRLGRDASEEEEAFESVSQVSGPRAPVWDAAASGQRLRQSGYRGNGVEQAPLSHQARSRADATAAAVAGVRVLRAEDLKMLPAANQMDAYFTKKHMSSDGDSREVTSTRRASAESDCKNVTGKRKKDVGTEGHHNVDKHLPDFMVTKFKGWHIHNGSEDDDESVTPKQQEQKRELSGAKPKQRIG